MVPSGSARAARRSTLLPPCFGVGERAHRLIQLCTVTYSARPLFEEKGWKTSVWRASGMATIGPSQRASLPAISYMGPGSAALEAKARPAWWDDK